MIDYAVKRPDSRAGAIVANAIGFNQNLLEKLDEHIEKQMSRDKDFLTYRLHKQFFDKQREILFDTQIPRKVIVTSRRGGKTELAAGKIVQTAIDGDSPIVYIHLNFTNAINQLFDKVVSYSESIGLPIKSNSKSTGEITWANGSTLLLRGNSTSAEADKLRGYKFRLVIIDEGGAQRWLRYLVDEVISPLLLDFGDKSELILQGTPPRIPKTFFETQVWNSAAFKKYTWGLLDNPFLTNPMDYVNDICEKRGLSIDSPFIQREYFGVMGAYDIEAMVYKDRKYYDKPPAFKVTDIAIGIDYGFSDYNAIIGLAYNRDLKQGYFFFEDKFNRATITEIVESTKRAVEEAKKIAFRDNMDMGRLEIVADTNEQSITFELSTVYKLPAFNSYKYNKEMAIQQLAEELRTGRIVMKKGGALDEEMDTLIYYRDEQDNILPVIDDEQGGHPDAADAALYAFRQYSFNCELKKLDDDTEAPSHYHPGERPSRPLPCGGVNYNAIGDILSHGI